MINEIHENYLIRKVIGYLKILYNISKTTITIKIQKAYLIKFLTN